MLRGGPLGLLIYINVCAFQIGHFTPTAERICHDALSFRASTFGRGSFLFMILEGQRRGALL